MTAAEAALSLRRKLVAAHHAKGSALTEREWLDLAEAELAVICAQQKARSPKATGFALGAGQSDDEWLAEIGSHPALVGVNIRQEVESCRLWSSSRGVKPSRRRIVNWLLKAVADRPMTGGAERGRFAGQVVDTQPKHPGAIEPEPMGWREEFPEFVGVGDPWHKLSAFHRTHIIQKMAELEQRQA